MEHGTSGNITNAPLFLDRAAGDYRLLATSPCIDAGLNDLASSLSGLDGNPRIADGDFDGVAIVDMGAYEFQILEVAIEVRPRAINLGSKGRCSGAIRSTADFDVSDLDPASVRFAGAAPVHISLLGNGALILHFKTTDLDLAADATEAMLIGQTYGGQLIAGADSIKIVPARR